MLHVGLDLSRKRVDVCLISSEGELVEHFRAPSDRDGLYGLSRRVAVYDARVLAELSFRDLVPAIWLPTPELRAERERARWRLHLVKHRATLKNRIHASLIAFGHQVPMADLFGVGGRRLLASLEFPEPWLGHVQA